MNMRNPRGDLLGNLALGVGVVFYAPIDLVAGRCRVILPSVGQQIPVAYIAFSSALTRVWAA